MMRDTRNRVLAALLAAAAWTSPPTALAKELKLATYLPPTHRIVALYEELGHELAKETNGDLTLKVYAGGTLGAGPFQQYKRAVEGVADIADICHAFHAKVFAKTMLIVLPGAATSALDATTRLWSLPEAALASDYKEVKNVFMYTVSQAALTSREKPVRTMADLKGAKVFSPGAAFAPIVGAWGASPVPMDLNDMFNALSTGVVDMVALWRAAGTAGEQGVKPLDQAIAQRIVVGEAGESHCAVEGAYIGIARETLSLLVNEVLGQPLADLLR